ncbi:helix-turn-helix transcriptional regulator [Corallococcus llansteffanensis]|uniref:HTH luxR-type domain-containing protein n=1 Tax=Corallococcus llansteffanensis TaxID=2316731 RepID=A0A3A8P586_9BACT|nr:helix-turn-helix transcriptional regulator [Corallococcus llansteffanensis]RKH51483.1 hypothetical protein D7V93_29185 [Corallococcus llansteffanensis]
MGRALKFASREQGLISEMRSGLIEVQSYEDIHTVIADVLAQLCGADHIALGFANLDGSAGLEWMTRTAMPLLKDYPEWALRCFVFQATMAQPNIVLSGPQMLRGQALEDTETYQRSRAVDLNLRHVLAALLMQGQQGLKGGIAVYRETQRPFPLQAQRLLQEVTPDIKGAVSSVQRFYSLRLENDLLKTVSAEPGATLFVLPHRRDIVRTHAATALLEKWFAPHELHHGVPRAWMEWVNHLSTQEGTPDAEKASLVKGLDGKTLQATFTRSPVRWNGRLLWEVRIVEHSHWMRADWLQLLTDKELEVADCLKQGAANKDIANKFNRSLHTVREHVKAIFIKTGVHSRGEFVAQARRS